MNERENSFFELALKAEALLLGDFTLKSGRKSPYFFNISSFFELGLISELSSLYANLIIEENIEFDVIFGPAYKGIPLAAAVATIMSERTSNPISISFDRKEEKTHGEGGKLIGRASREPYDFRESVALDGDELLGLGLDYDNLDEDENDELMIPWLDQIIKEFG